MNEWDERILEWTENWMKDKWERKMWTDVLERRTEKNMKDNRRRRKKSDFKKKKINGEKSKFKKKSDRYLYLVKVSSYRT